MNRNYQRGREAEYRVKDELTRLGFAAVRSASSHGPYDVSGVRSDCVVFVQCKQGERPSPCEYRAIVELPAPELVLRLVVWYPVGRVAPRILWHSGETLPEWVRLSCWEVGLAPKQKSMRLAW
jgi:Holliday junction resolvase